MRNRFTPSMRRGTLKLTSRPISARDTFNVRQQLCVVQRSMAQPMMRWVNVSLSSRLFIMFSVSSVSLCPLCLNKPVDYVLA